MSTDANEPEVHETFELEDSRPLYLMTALLGVLIALDLALGLDVVGNLLPGYTNEVFSVRFALIAALIGGARTLYGSLEGVFEGEIGADLALALACIAAILIGEPLVAAEVVFIGMVGESLEAITFGRTKRELRSLLELRPPTATVLRDGEQVSVPSSELEVGDRILVKPGERIGADGVVVRGRTSVDQSALTGEGLPADKGPGDEVYTGTLNQTGSIEFEAAKVGRETTFGQLLTLIEEAEERKAPVERTVDRYARYFLPVVLLCAGLTYLATRDMYRTVAVLVVACPCALVLATPAAVLAAVARLAKSGVVLRGGLALERLAGATALVFDKTGTLTEGKPTLGDLSPLTGCSGDDLLRIAAAAEQHSEHPFGKVLLAGARERGFELAEVEEFEALPGEGVRASIAGAVVLVGNRRLLEGHGVRIPDELVALLDQVDRAGQTGLFVAQGGRPLGVIGLCDTIRPEAKSVVEELRRLGFDDIALVTGDRLAAARHVAEHLGITEVLAEQLPAAKAAFIERWRSAAKKVAMIGDGINDAPALAISDVGLALGGVGANIAAEAGDIVLMKDPLEPLPFAVRIARQTLRIIQQNILIFAFLVNGTAILLSAWGVLPPIGAAIYHQVGSLLGLLNAMRLLFFERWHEVWFVRSFERLDGLVGGIASRLDPMAPVAAMIEHRGGLLRAGVVGLALLGVSRCVWVIDADEVAVLQRFGKTRTQWGPGLHFGLPVVDRVHRVRPLRIQTVEIGFRGEPVADFEAFGSQTIEWNSPHGGYLQPMVEEGLVMTGDESVVDLNAVVSYRIIDVERYLFGVNDPAGGLRAIAESVLRSLAARTPERGLLTTGRYEFERRALDILETRVGPQWYDLGIGIVDVSLRDVHPPLDVVSAYHRVSAAMEEREQRINTARAAALTVELLADSQSEKRINQAKGFQSREVANALGARDAYLARQAAYRSAPQITRNRLFWETVESSLKDRTKIVLDPNASGRRRILLGDFETNGGLQPPMIDESGFPDFSEH